MNKLSKHVLGMKFMRRTKEQVVTEKTETKFRQHYSKSASTSNSAREAESKPVGTNGYSREIEMIGSYNQIEGFIFGRQSFGGFNPVVEYNVSRGIWKPCYLVDDTEDAVQDPDHNSDPEPEENDDEVDVPDKEMARTFGSLVGTLGKKFLRKRDRGGGNNKKGGHKGKGPSTSNHQLAKGDGGNDKRKRNKNKSPNKNKFEEQGTKNSEPLTIDLTNEEPPRKRSKFMKPSE